MDMGKLNVDELIQGYSYDKKDDVYICNYCEEKFKGGQVYPEGNVFLLAENAVKNHIDTVHDGNFRMLIQNESRYDTLTENQKELLYLFRKGYSDNEIAAKLDITPSTVRRQKFAFREKTKEAKLYLALYEQVFGGERPENDAENDIIPVHENAKYVDDRYLITEKERKQIIERFFISENPLKLKLFSPKEKNKVVILMRISEAFSKGTQYSEQWLNGALKEIYDDYAEIRRYLVMYGFFERRKDGSAYWRIK